MPQMRYGPTVIKLRAKRRLSQEELAALMDVSRATVQNIEGDKKAPQGSTIRKLAAALGMGVEEFDAEVEKDNAPTVTFDVPLKSDPAPTLKGRGIDPARPPQKQDYSVSNVDAVKEDEIMPTFESLSAGGLSSADIDTLIESLGDEQRFKVKIRGDSMDDGTQAGYPSGCWVVFSRPAALSEGLTYGRDYLVWANGDESTFKRIERHADQRQYLILRALNPDRGRYKDQVIHRREVAYIARAVRKDIPIP